MLSIPPALSAMAEYPQWIVWTIDPEGKKVPVDGRDGRLTHQIHTGEVWLSAEAAILAAATLGEAYGVGFVFTAADPFFFVDIDHCAENGAWSPVATELMAHFPGAAIEVSQSGTGLHIFGRGACPPHSCKNIPLGLELYTEKRFVALTGSGIVGDSGTDHSAALATVVAKWYPPRVMEGTEYWTEEPVVGSNPIPDDAELIAAASKTASVWGESATFAQLWAADPVALGEHFADGGGRAWDGSSADAALAQHLAFWTGNDCARIDRLMRQSALVRDKWEREDYIERTILRAVSMQSVWHQSGGVVDNSLAKEYGGKALKGSDKQRQWAESQRAKVLDSATEEQRAALCTTSGPAASCKFWIEHGNEPTEELVLAATPAPTATAVAAAAATAGVELPTLVTGYQYLSGESQQDYFAGCFYVTDINRMLMSNGMLLCAQQVNARLGGYTFQMDDTGDKTTRKAWEAFTESQCVRWPSADSSVFRPSYPYGTIFHEDNRRLVNRYRIVDIARKVGDAGPFLRHLETLLPNQRDRDMLLAYMAACVQYQGQKFKWCPLIQGVEGNGKTLFSMCVARAVGMCYSHFPKAEDIGNKFNAWMLDTIFVSVEDIFVQSHKMEVLEALKPMITGEVLEVQRKGVDQVTVDICANFILNSNHADAIKKTENDRRFGFFGTAQQEAKDIIAAGMGGEYFPDLYNWLNAEGFAIVSELLHTHPIPDEYNPTTQMQRAPKTSTTDKAIRASKGRIEQEVLEAVSEGRVGFRGGWISSVALDSMLKDNSPRGGISHHKRRELLLSLGYDYHPGLTDGRVNNGISIDGGRRPRLYIHSGAGNLRLLSGCAEIVAKYTEDQNG